MKTVLCLVFILSAAIAINAFYSPGHDGKPGCKTAKEIEQRVWRNNYNPVAYWVCSNLNEPATYVQCPPETAFLTSMLTCVDWNNWQWEEPNNPPSMSI